MTEYFQIVNLTCNHMTDPIGMDERPHFSYQLTSRSPGVTQAAYRIRVFDENGDVWDSGRVESDRQVLIPYGGRSLQPLTGYGWTVSVWDQEGNCVNGPTARFEMGRLCGFGWPAKWITATLITVMVGNKSTKRSESTAPYMRREFEISKPVADATLSICGIGYYECYINGRSVKDTVLDPAFTEYDKAVLYKTHKIPNLRVGKNAIGVVLGDGFYNAATDDVWNYVNAPWRDHAKCILILRIRYTDGTVEELASDGSFKGTTGPLLTNDVRTAEVYDARLELGDWTMPDYDDSAWNPVRITKAPGGALVGQYTTPIRVVAEYQPESVERISDTQWLVDVGFNTSGWLKLAVDAPAGTEICFRYKERNDPVAEEKNAIWGCLKPNEKETVQTSRYITKGQGREIWHPIFQYHGFRYVEVTCQSGIPAEMELTVQEVRTDLREAGGFTCSDPVLNRLQEITCRATRTNFHHMPTDCPHREKNGWTGDAQLSAEQLLMNFDGAAAYDRWLDDVIRAQRPSGQLPGIVPSTGWGFNWGSGPAWDSVCAVLPYTMYLYRGDTRVIQKMYPTVKRYLDFCASMAVDNICAWGLGDWCPPKTLEGHQGCEVAVTDTGYYYLDTCIAAKMAALLGEQDEAEVYRQKAREIRASFRKHFIRRADTELELINCTASQATLASMLYFGMVEPDERRLFLDALKARIHALDDHFDVGILGAKFICHVLIDAGEAELMLKAALNPTFPSWGYMVGQGATTLWENWDGRASQNHHMFGDISACLYQGLAGIRPDEGKPGFRHTVFRPQFVRSLRHVNAWHDSPYGRIVSEWERRGREILWKITVPTGCTGEVILPAGTRLADPVQSLHLVSGNYQLRVLPE